MGLKYPVAYWKFDEGSGTTAADQYGGHTGTLVGGPTWVAGHSGDALQFSSDGSKYVQVPIAPDLKPAYATVAMWVKMNSFAGSTDKALCCGYRSNGSWFTPYISIDVIPGNSSGNPVFEISTQGTQHTLTAAGTISTGAWHHLAMVFDGSTMYIYIDGSQDANTNDIIPFDETGNPSGPPQSLDFSLAGDYAIGARSPYNTGEGIDGVIDEVMLYNFALNADQVSGLYSTGDPGVSVPGGDSSASASHPTVSSGGTSTVPAFSGSCTKTCSHPTVSSGGSRAVPAYSGSCSVSSAAAISASSHFSAAVYSGAATLTASHPTVSDHGLVGYWPFDEGSGTTAHDSSGVTGDGTLVGGPTWSTGKIGGAVRFASTVANYVEAPTLAIADGFTIAFWNRWDGSSTLSFAMGTKYAAYNNPGGFLTYVAPGYPLWDFIGPGASYARMTISVDASWHHYAVTMTSGVLYMYIDGVLLNPGGTSVGTLTASPDTLRIGVRDQAYLTYAGGDADDLRVYGRVLSDPEIATLASGVSLGQAKGTYAIPNPIGLASVSSHPTASAAGVNLVPEFQGRFVQSLQHPTVDVSTSIGKVLNAPTTLFVYGTAWPEWLQSMPLVAHGHSDAFAGPTLPLAIQGPLPSQASPNLYVSGGVFGPATPRSMTLVMSAPDTALKSMALSVAAVPAPSSSGSSPLAVTGHADRPTMVRAVPLAVGGWDYSPPYGALSLNLRGADYGGLSGVLNLAVAGANAGTAFPLPLVLRNDWQDWLDDVALYVRGDGLVPGAFPLSESVSLHVERGPQSGVTLYLQNSDCEAVVPLFIAGTPESSSSATLSVVGFGDQATGSATLSLPNAAVPVAADAQATLAVPAVVSDLSSPQNLYVNGWTPPQE